MDLSISSNLLDAKNSIMVDFAALSDASANNNEYGPVNLESSSLLGRLGGLLKALESGDSQDGVGFNVSELVADAEQFVDDVSGKVAMASVAVTPFLPPHLKLAAVGIAAGVNYLDGALKLLKASSSEGAVSNLVEQVKLASMEVFENLDQIVDSHPENEDRNRESRRSLVDAMANTLKPDSFSPKNNSGPSMG